MSDLYVHPSLTIPGSELTVTTSRSSGPGGQNVNKVNSKVTLRWAPEQSDAIDPAWCERFISRYASRINNEGELVLHSDRHRDQPSNLSDVRYRLIEMLLEVRRPPKKRKRTRPTMGSKRRRLKAKKEKSEKKQRRRATFDDRL